MAAQPLKAPKNHPLVQAKDGTVSRPWLSWLQDLSSQVNALQQASSSGGSGSGGGGGGSGAGGGGGGGTSITVEGTSGTGTADTITKWMSPTTLGDSIAQEIGTTFRINGGLSAQTGHIDGTLDANRLLGALAPSYLDGFPHDGTAFLNGAGGWTKPIHYVNEIAGGTIDGVNGTFTTAHPARELTVFLNGLQLIQTDWAVLSPTSFRIFTPPLSTAPADVVTVSYAI